jgi:hypothetical protein
MIPHSSSSSRGQNIWRIVSEEIVREPSRLSISVQKYTILWRQGLFESELDRRHRARSLPRNTSSLIMSTDSVPVRGRNMYMRTAVDGSRSASQDICPYRSNSVRRRRDVRLNTSCCALLLRTDVAESGQTTIAPRVSALSEAVIRRLRAWSGPPAWAGNTQSEIVVRAAGARCKVNTAGIARMHGLCRYFSDSVGSSK